MARRMPSAVKPAPAALPAQLKSVGPSRKSKGAPVKSPVKSNLSAKVKRTSDMPKPASGV
jgi:hypothetical protein